MADRRAGKTYQMMEQVRDFKRAYPDAKVVVVGHNARFLQYLRSMARSLGIDGVKFQTVEGAALNARGMPRALFIDQFAREFTETLNYFEAREKLFREQDRYEEYSRKYVEVKSG